VTGRFFSGSCPMAAFSGRFSVPTVFQSVSELSALSRAVFARGLSWNARILHWRIDIVRPGGRLSGRRIAAGGRLFDGDIFFGWRRWFLNRPVGWNVWFVLRAGRIDVGRDHCCTCGGRRGAGAAGGAFSTREPGITGPSCAGVDDGGVVVGGGAGAPGMMGRRLSSGFGLSSGLGVASILGFSSAFGFSSGFGAGAEGVGIGFGTGTGFISGRSVGGGTVMIGGAGFSNMNGGGGVTGRLESIGFDCAGCGGGESTAGAAGCEAPNSVPPARCTGAGMVVGFEYGALYGVEYGAGAVSRGTPCASVQGGGTRSGGIISS
jgi:hypothetical protein